MTGPAGLAGAVRRTVHVEHPMGTVASIDVRDDAPDAVLTCAVEAAVAGLHRFDRRFSTFRDDSEVSRSNRADLRVDELSAEPRHVCALSAELGGASGGVFTPYPPDGVTLDGADVVKGWSIDRTCHVLRESGLHNWSLNVGGDVLVSGAPVPGQLWRVAVRDPFAADRTSGVHD